MIGTFSVIAGVLLIRHPLGGAGESRCCRIWLIAAGVAGSFRRSPSWATGSAHRCRASARDFGIVIVSAPHIIYATLALTPASASSDGIGTLRRWP